MDTTKFTLELDSNLIKLLDEEAERTERSRVGLIKFILREYFKKEDAKIDNT